MIEFDWKLGGIGGAIGLIFIFALLNFEISIALFGMICIAGVIIFLVSRRGGKI